MILFIYFIFYLSEGQVIETATKYRGEKNGVWCTRLKTVRGHAVSSLATQHAEIRPSTSLYLTQFFLSLPYAGVAWYAFTHEPFASMMGSTTEKAHAISRGGSKPPTVPGKEKVDESPSATISTKPQSPTHSGVAQAHSENR